jgi:acetoin utilization protein AcuB
MIKAKTIMTENVITVKQDVTIAEAAELMANKKVKSLVVTENQKPIAMVTQRDMIKGSLNKSPRTVKIKSIMSKNFLAINSETNYNFLVKKLRENKISRFPVIENGKLVGIITETDIVDATRDFTRFHQIMQEVILTIFGLVTAFVLFFFSPVGQSILGK